MEKFLQWLKQFLEVVLEIIAGIRTHLPKAPAKIKTIAISSGHGLHVPGASSVLNEVTEARRVVRAVAERLRASGVDVAEFHDNTSRNQTDNISAIVAWHNARDCDINLSAHFNAFQPTAAPMGTEALYVSKDTASIASALAEAVAAAGRFRLRHNIKPSPGAVLRNDLGFLNRTGNPAVLLEVCFVDSAADAELYESRFDRICDAIADTLRAAGETRP